MRVTGVGPRRRWATSVVAASAALALTACSSESTAGGGSDGEPVNEEAAQVVQEAQERIEARLAGQRDIDRVARRRDHLERHAGDGRIHAGGFTVRRGLGLQRWARPRFYQVKSAFTVNE